MIIKSLFEIAFYSSLLVAKKVGSTIGENLPFSEKRKQKKVTLPLKTVKNQHEKIESNEVTKKEKGATIKQEPIVKPQESKKTIPQEEAKVMNYSLKTKKELYEIAQEIDLEGRSKMNKTQLLKALKEHAKN